MESTDADTPDPTADPAASAVNDDAAEISFECSCEVYLDPSDGRTRYRLVLDPHLNA